VKSKHENYPIFGMMNIGTNPTISNDKNQSIEVHFFDFDKKFDSITELKKQIELDKLTALHFIANI